MKNCFKCGKKVKVEDGLLAFFRKYGYGNLKFFRCNNCWSDFLEQIWDYAGKDRTIICEKCGKESLLHFKPERNSPLMCRKCYDIENKAD